MFRLLCSCIILYAPYAHTRSIFVNLLFTRFFPTNLLDDGWDSNSLGSIVQNWTVC